MVILAMVQKARKEMGKLNTTVYGAATDSYDFFFYHLNEAGEVSEICTRWLFCHITNHRSGRNVSSAGARTPKKTSPSSAFSPRFSAKLPFSHPSLQSSPPPRGTIAKSLAGKLDTVATKAKKWI